MGGVAWVAMVTPQPRQQAWPQARSSPKIPEELAGHCHLCSDTGPWSCSPRLNSATGPDGTGGGGSSLASPGGVPRPWAGCPVGPALGLKGCLPHVP